MTQGEIERERRRLLRLLTQAQTPQGQGKLIALLANPAASAQDREKRNDRKKA